MGYLYVIVNEAFEGWVKVGTTDNLTKGYIPIKRVTRFDVTK